MYIHALDSYMCACMCANNCSLNVSVPCSPINAGMHKLLELLCVDYSNMVLPMHAFLYLYMHV